MRIFALQEGRVEAGSRRFAHSCCQSLQAQTSSLHKGTGFSDEDSVPWSMANHAECTCRLAGAEFRDRVTASSKVLRSAQSCNELRGGYAFEFETSSERLHQLAELIDAERQCCPFLTFVLQVPAHKNALILKIKGPEGAKQLIRTELLVE